MSNDTENANSKYEINWDLLTSDQKVAMRKMVDGENMLITGPAGTGKSYLIEEFREYCDNNKKTVAVTSTTGVSALNIGGTTVHSWAGIGLGKDTVLKLVRHIRCRKKYKQRWLQTDVLIIDEISMLSSELFEKLDSIGKKVRGNYIQPFGGLQIILVGDFCQLPPVPPRNRSYEKKDERDFCFESKVWEHVIHNVVHLKDIVRQEDKVFKKCLNEIRMGIMTEDSEELLMDRVLDPTIVNGIKPTKLFSYKANVKQINLRELKKLKKENDYRSYMSKVKIKNKNGFKLLQSQIDRYVKMLDSRVQAEQELEVAIGSQVMLICNLCLEQNLANGSRGVVIGFTEDKELPIVRFVDGREITVEPWDWVLDLEQDGVELTLRQVPLILADAITIHKSQSSTLDFVEIDLGKTIFEYGQFYTALSRVRTLEGLYITDLDFDKFEKINIHPKVLEFYNKYG